MPGVSVAAAAVLVQVRGRWGVPAVEIAAQIRRAVAALAPGRAINVAIGDIGDPPAGRTTNMEVHEP